MYSRGAAFHNTGLIILDMFRKYKHMTSQNGENGENGAFPKAVEMVNIKFHLQAEQKRTGRVTTVGSLWSKIYCRPLTL